jgi:pimeloyl-ACP methyl ester carboxylesterase
MIRGLCIRKPPKKVLDSVVDDAMLVSARSLREFVADKHPVNGLERLETLKVPTLVVIGGKDTAVPVGQQKELARRIPGAKMVMYPEEGHMVTYEKQDEVFRETMTFLESAVPT